jgi:hypothetical protein
MLGELRHNEVGKYEMENVTFELRIDGLYQSENFASPKRIASDCAVITLVCVGDEIAVTGVTIPPCLSRFGLKPISAPHVETAYNNDDGMNDAIIAAVERIHANLKNRDGILDVSNQQQLSQRRHELLLASGFVVTVPGAGTMLAVKPTALRAWVSGEVPLGQVIKKLRESGLLICGANGTSTRQVVIGELGRQRYYCFKPISGSDIPEYIEMRSPPRSRSPRAPAMEKPRVPGPPLQPRRPVVW